MLTLRMKRSGTVRLTVHLLQKSGPHVASEPGSESQGRMAQG